jgi:RHS repeat-associated protein
MGPKTFRSAVLDQLNGAGRVLPVTADITYDANGNTLSDSSGKQYSWDFENRLTQAIVPNVGTTTFRYDPFGRRIQKAGPLGTTNFLYSGANLIEEVDGSGGALARYVQLGKKVDRPLAEVRSGITSYYEQDGLGSVTSLSNSTGALAQTYTYDSYGKLAASTGTLTNSLQYTAREFDQETGIYYYRHRYYDADTGRFLGEDPIQFRGGIDFYRYSLNSPIGFKDPFGLTATCYYAQTTGHLVCYDDDTGDQIVNVTGYSGGGEGTVPGSVNNPASECDKNTGTIPWGVYTIGQDDGNIAGGNSLPLTPLPGSQHCPKPRTGLYIHADNSCQCQSASKGCIVTPYGPKGKNAREAIDDAGGGILFVSLTDDGNWAVPPDACTGASCGI